MDLVTRTGYNQHQWNLNKDNVDKDNWFLMDSPIPLLTIMGSYWFFVLKLGPMVMKNKSPFTLTNILAVYNVFQILLSFYIFQYGINFLWSNGFIQTECVMDKYDVKQQTSKAVYIYFLAKITELLDTIFFILRKKYNQASFLHIYHHSITVISTWLTLKYEPNANATIFLGTLNSFVHVIMYTYYALSAYPQYAKYLWWKKYITRLQLVQFVVILTHMLIEYKFTKCKVSYILISVVSVNLLLFVYLFSDFYLKTYTQNKSDKYMNGYTKREEKKVD